MLNNAKHDDLIPPPSSRDSQPANRTRWRAVVIGTLLLPANAYWIASGEATSTTVSLFFNIIFVLFVLLLLNLLFKQIAPNAALNQGELLIVYVMLSISSGIAGLDMMRVLMAVLVGPFWYARPENEWAELFWRFIPSWLAVQDKEILKGFAEGESSFYVPEVVQAWIFPALIWSRIHFSTSVWDALHQRLGTQTVDRGGKAELSNHSTAAADDRWTLLSPFQPHDVDWVWARRWTRYSQWASFSVSNYPRSGWAALRPPSLFHKQAVECNRLDTGCHFSLCGWTWILNTAWISHSPVGFFTCSGKWSGFSQMFSACTLSRSFPISNSRPQGRTWGYF